MPVNLKGCVKPVKKRDATVLPLAINIMEAHPHLLTLYFLSMSHKHQRDILAKYLPAPAVDEVFDIIASHSIHLHIKAARSTKLGDFKAPHNGLPARLSINGDLNPYAFLITLIHEIAHWLVWDEHKANRKIRPHGKEWKQTFAQLMQPFLRADIFPENLLLVLSHHMKNPKASSSSDLRLMKALKTYDAGEKQMILADLNVNAHFKLKGRVFQIMKKNRSRFMCREQNSKRIFLVHSLVEVESIER